MTDKEVIEQCMAESFIERAAPKGKLPSSKFASLPEADRKMIEESLSGDGEPADRRSSPNFDF